MKLIRPSSYCRQLATENGFCIYDEMITGFRVDVGGAKSFGCYS